MARRKTAAAPSLKIAKTSAPNDALRPSDDEGEQAFGKRLVQRRSDEWWEHQMKWRWLLDSYEGGQRYRDAAYGFDRKGLAVRNLLRHRREYPDPTQWPTAYTGMVAANSTLSVATAGLAFGPGPGQIGANPGATAQDDEFENRRARTPVPEFVSEAAQIHLAKIYDQEIKREGPDELVRWWKDVDGRGTPMDEYMQTVLAPLLAVTGNMDIVMDRPRLPKGAEAPKSKKEEQDLGLDRCIASYILPENMVWWRLDDSQDYEECLVKEWADSSDRKRPDAGMDLASIQQSRNECSRYRHWKVDEWVLYNFDGSKEIDRGPNPYGYIPIQRLVDLPVHRQPQVGKSRYERIAGLQQAYYNVDSELTLSNTLQSLPLLSGPEDYLKSEHTLSIGPNYVLPKKCSNQGTHAAYEGWEYVSPPKDPANSLRQKLLDIRDESDRAACLTKPAGVSGTSANSVSQSATSKTIDAHTGDKLLTSLARTFARVERQMAERAWLCLNPGKQLTPEIRASIKIVYPARFNLFGASELCALTQQIQMIASSAGELPTLEGTLIRTIAEAALPGMPDGAYEEIAKEIEMLMDSKSQLKEGHHDLKIAAIESQQNVLDTHGTTESEAGSDPVGQSGATTIGNMITQTY